MAKEYAYELEIDMEILKAEELDIDETYNLFITEINKQNFELCGVFTGHPVKKNNMKGMIVHYNGTLYLGEKHIELDKLHNMLLLFLNSNYIIGNVIQCTFEEIIEE